MFSGTDHRSAASIDLDNENVTVADRRRKVLEEGSGQVADAIDHAQYSARAGGHSCK
jgi:hypothetical protein